jgi:hypothetical protein
MPSVGSLWSDARVLSRPDPVALATSNGLERLAQLLRLHDACEFLGGFLGRASVHGTFQCSHLRTNPLAAI